MDIEAVLILGGFAQLGCAILSSTITNKGLNQSYLACALSCLVAICLNGDLI